MQRDIQTVIPAMQYNLIVGKLVHTMNNFFLDEIKYVIIISAN